LAGELARGLYSFDRWDLLTELEQHRERVAGVENKLLRISLSWLVREISDALVDLDMFPIQDIPSQPRLA
jgi:hypothetical protein